MSAPKKVVPRKLAASDSSGVVDCAARKRSPVELPNLARTDLKLAINGLAWKGLATEGNVEALIALLDLEDA